VGKATIKKQEIERKKKEIYEESLREPVSSGFRTFDLRKSDLFGMNSFSELMIRSEDSCSFSKYKTEKSFVYYVSRHLFSEYRIPGFMDQAWTDPMQDLFQFWFVAIGRGMSVYKKCSKKYMTKKATHLFLTKGKKDLTIFENIWLARAMAEDINPTIAITLIKANPRMCLDLNDKFWLNIFTFFCKNPIRQGKKLSEVIDFLLEKQVIEPTFSLRGRTVSSLIQLSDQWHEDLARMKKNGIGKWIPMPISDWRKAYGREKRKREYEVNQIITGKELSREGNVMHHCVYSYKRRCIAGEASIFSMRKTSFETGRNEFVTRRCATIEVDKNKRIVQARGYANRNLNRAEKNALNEWAKERCLSVPSHIGYW